MADEYFRLTALDVRRFVFDTALRGYDRARVDDFREQVAEEMERLTRENHELAMRARTAVEQLAAFKEREAALNEALVSAQQMRGEVREQAEREAHRLARDAHAAVEAQLQAGREAVYRVEAELQQLWQRRTALLASLREQVERQLNDLVMAERQPIPTTPVSSVPPVVPMAPTPSPALAAPVVAADSVAPAAPDPWATPAPEPLRRKPVRPPAWLLDDA